MDKLSFASHSASQAADTANATLDHQSSPAQPIPQTHGAFDALPRRSSGSAPSTLRSSLPAQTPLRAIVSQREIKMKRLEESLQLWQGEAKTESERSARESISVNMLKCAQRGSQSLVLSDLSSVPPGLGALERLRDLYIFDSQIETLPDDVGDCRNLTVLHISDCDIAGLPESIGRLGDLDVRRTHSLVQG